jgi:hypothetical protein
MSPPGRNSILVHKEVGAGASEPKPPSQRNDSFVRGGTATAIRVPDASLYRSVMLWLGIGCVFSAEEGVIPGHRLQSTDTQPRHN